MNDHHQGLETPGRSGRSHFVDSHARVASRLSLLVAKTRQGDRDGVADLFARVASEVGGHMAAEEAFFLAKFRLANASEAARLDAEHGSIRDQLAWIQTESRQGTLRPEALERLLGSLIDHAAREKVVFYAWAQDRFLESVWVKAARLLSSPPTDRAW
jgi:hypothetical protein